MTLARKPGAPREPEPTRVPRAGYERIPVQIGLQILSAEHGPALGARSLAWRPMFSTPGDARRE